MSGEIIAKTNRQIGDCERVVLTASGRDVKKEREKDVREDLHDVRSDVGEADYWESGLVPHCVSHISLPHHSLAIARNFYLTAAMNDTLETKVILVFRNNQIKRHLLYRYDRSINRRQFYEK